MADEGTSGSKKRKKDDAHAEYMDIITQMKKEMEILRKTVEQLQIKCERQENTMKQQEEELEKLRQSEHEDDTTDESEAEEEAMVCDDIATNYPALTKEEKPKKKPARKVEVLFCGYTNEGNDNKWTMIGKNGKPATEENTEKTTEESTATTTKDSTKKPTIKNVSRVKSVKVNKKSIPIITTFNIDMKHILRTLTNALGHQNFEVNILSKKVTNLSVCTLQDHEKIIKVLTEHKVEFYTYTPKGAKPYMIVVKRLSSTFDVEDVKEYLNGLNIKLEVLGLTKMGGDRWLLKLSKDSDLVAFHEIKCILHCRVRFERFKKTGPTQCYRCQRFGHVATNCNMTSRCVKCAEFHESEQCTIPKKSENTAQISVTDQVTGAVTVQIGQTVKCVNCDAVGHTAGSKKCPRKLAIVEKMQQKRVAYRTERPKPSRANAHIRPGISFANVVGPSPSLRTPSGRISTPASTPSLGSAQSNFSMLDQDCQKFFGKDIFSCLDKVGNFADGYKRMQDDSEKKRALFGLMISMKLNE